MIYIAIVFTVIEIKVRHRCFKLFNYEHIHFIILFFLTNQPFIYHLTLSFIISNIILETFLFVLFTRLPTNVFSHQ